MALDLADLAGRLSSALSCYALALRLHDDDLFLYHLYLAGECLDSYNSCPQYFENERLSDARVRQQRHAPVPFQALLPADRSLENLQALLHRGWWNSHDTGNLDDGGVPLGYDDGFVFERDRMTVFGTMLKLDGTDGLYPYAAWAEALDVPWAEFVAVQYVSS